MAKAIKKTATAAALVVALLVSGQAAQAPKLRTPRTTTTEVTR